MKTSGIIEGLSILQKYMDDDGYNVGAEHDVLYFFTTDKPVGAQDLERLVELGWFQEDADYGDDEETGGDYGVKHYDDALSWACYV